MQLRTSQGLSGKPLRTERFHVTLHHLGDYPELRQDIVAKAMEAASTLAMPPFQLEFNRAESFANRSSNRPFVLRGGDGLEKLLDFQQALSLALKRVGLGEHAKGTYTPHITLLYDTHAVAGLAIEPVAWTAQEFVLMRSLIGQTRHIPLARWPLRG